MRKLMQTVAALAFALCAALGAANAAEDELLHPDEAYVLDASVDGETLIAQWTIAPGYYLYRNKFTFESAEPGITLGTVDYPAGKIKEDEFFGRMEIYRGLLTIRIPLARADQTLQQFTLMAGLQGCADIGVCYPPQIQTRTVALPATSSNLSSSVSNSGGGVLSGLRAMLGNSQQDQEFLDPDQAYQHSVTWLDANTIVARWDIADGYYLYKDKFKFKLPDHPEAAIGAPLLRKGKIKEDETLKFEIGYQGCAEAGLCYPPMTKTASLVPPAAGTAASASLAGKTTPERPGAPPITEQDALAAQLLEQPLWLSLGLFFLIGIGLTFTPCVFPMIPILSSIIAGQGDKLTTRGAFNLSLVYVLAMALTYTVAGIVIALLGANVQAAFQNPWILGSFAALFVVLSFSMFGFYELQMPNAIQNRLAAVSNKQHGGTYIGAAVMGLLSALIVGPCITAPLVAALLVIGQTGDPVLGGSALFAMSMGMGVPLLVVGTSAGKFLPRAGAWMDAVKSVFGVMLLAVAIWMLERIIPAGVTLFLWAALLIVSAVYMGAITPLPANGNGWHKLRKGTGLIMLSYGVLLLVGVAGGGTDPLQPLKGVSFTKSTEAAGKPSTHELAFKRIKNAADLEAEVKLAAADGRLVMVDFYADWCISCKEMEKYTFSDPQVQSTLNNMVMLQADVTANDEVDQALLKKFGLFGPPTILFYGPDGMERSTLRVMGYMDADQFLAHLQRVIES
jgi:thiol:disulfide interchange protein DsbD